MENQISFEDIFQFTSNGVLATDATCRIIHINSKAEAILKLNHEQHLGRNLLDILPLTGKSVQKCLNEQKPIFGQQVLGKKAELVLNVSPIVKDEILQGTICTFQELSVFEQAAKKIRSYQSLNHQLEIIFRSSSDGLWVCDGQGVVLRINEASEQLNGISSANVVGQKTADLLENGIFDQSVSARVMKTKKQATVMQFITKTQKHLLSTGTPSLDEKGNINLIVVNERDMTELNTLRERFEQSQKIKEKYQEELSELTLRDLKSNSVIAESSNMRRIVEKSLKLSRFGASNILILGESGTGKGLLAKLIHKNSQRKKNPFVEINCAALPENLLEAELFGYEKGAFTGASDKGKIGLIELAKGGSLFLDEIGDMPLLLQTKLLKYLDDHRIRRIGGTTSIEVSCSIIAATNQSLADLVQEKKFREDLYYRLNSFILELPPLKDRKEDISGLVRFYLKEYNQKYKCHKTIGAAAIRSLSHYPFPGNIRELKSIIENAVVMSEGTRIDDFVQTTIIDDSTPPETLLPASNEENLHLATRLEELEIHILRQARERYRTTREIAAGIGISQPSVVRKMKKYQID